MKWKGRKAGQAWAKSIAAGWALAQPRRHASCLETLTTWEQASLRIKKGPTTAPPTMRATCETARPGSSSSPVLESQWKVEWQVEARNGSRSRHVSSVGHDAEESRLHLRSSGAQYAVCTISFFIINAIQQALPMDISEQYSNNGDESLSNLVLQRKPKISTKPNTKNCI